MSHRVTETQRNAEDSKQKTVGLLPSAFRLLPSSLGVSVVNFDLKKGKTK